MKYLWGAADFAIVLVDLTTVPEDSTINPVTVAAGDGLADEAVEVDQTDQQPGQQNSELPEGISAFSGTTARTSHSGQELADLSSEEVLGALPKLSNPSDKILSYLMPQIVSEPAIASVMTRLHMTNSKKTLERLGDALKAQSNAFGNDTYISLYSTLSTLLGVRHVSDEEAGIWRPDALLQKANLAVLLMRVLSSSWLNQRADFIEELDDVFPQVFITKLADSEAITPGSSTLRDATFQLALEVRTQCAISLLARHSTQHNFDSNVVLQQIFFEDSKIVRGWSIASIRSEELTKEARKKILSRLQKLWKVFKTDDSGTLEHPSDCTEQLQQLFSWNNFVNQIVGWVNSRLNELHNQIQTCGGPQEITTALKKELQRRRQAPTLENDDAIRIDYESPPAESLNTASEQPKDLLQKPSRTRMLQLKPFRFVIPCREQT